MEINLLRIFSFDGPEPQATPAPGQADGSLLTGLSAFLQRFNEQVNNWAGITGLSDKVIIAIFLATITIILLLILILLLSIFNRNKKKKARRNSRPVSMARPAATKPVSSRPQQAGEPAPTAAAANSGFGLQFTLPDGKKFTFSGLPATIGRINGNTLVLSSEAVSTIHARLYYDPVLQAVCIEDQNSLNGVLVNGKPTRKNILNSGDQITIGDVSLVYQDTGYIPS